MPGSLTGKLADPAWRQARAAKAARARTTGSYHLDRVRDLVTSSRAAQGLPPTVTDDLTLGEIAVLIETGDGDAAP
jgi:hypothetical protein